MKKGVFTLTALLAVALLGACGGGDEAAREAGAGQKLIRLGATAGPFADQIRWGIAPILEEQGYRVRLTEFSDYVQPNIALADGALDANTFQHVVYLEAFARNRNLPIEPLVEVPTAPLGLYSRRHRELGTPPQGARVSLPNDPTNQARALVMLENLGWVNLREDIDPLRVSERDVAGSPYGLRLLPLEAPQLPRALDDVDYGFVNGNFAVASGLKLSEALQLEAIDSRYLNVVAIRSADRDAQWVRDLAAAYGDPRFRQLVAERFEGFALPSDWSSAP